MSELTNREKIAFLGMCVFALIALVTSFIMVSAIGAFGRAVSEDLDTLEDLIECQQTSISRYREFYRAGWNAAYTQIQVAPPAHFPSDL